MRRFIIFFVLFIGTQISVPRFLIINNLFLDAEIKHHLQQDKYRYAQYKDRKEGIYKEKQRIKGEKFDLLSASIENLEQTDKDNLADKYNLGFYLENSAKVEIKVRNFDKNYRMEPLQKNYSVGSNVFPWPSKIPLYFNIFIEDLSPLATISEKDLIVPIVLFYEKPQKKEISYKFEIFPYKTVAILQYNIYKADNNELFYTTKLRDIKKESIAYLHWHGKDMNNNIAPTGRYILNIQATFQKPPGAVNPVTVTVNYNFYHKADLFKSGILIRK